MGCAATTANDRMSQVMEKPQTAASPAEDGAHDNGHSDHPVSHLRPAQLEADEGSNKTPPVNSKEQSAGAKKNWELVKQRSASIRDEFELTDVEKLTSLTIVVLGASGDLAKKKTYPALFLLYAKGFFPPSTHITGYARSSMSDDQFREKIRGYLKDHKDKIDEFLKICTYMHGAYDEDAGYEALAKSLVQFETKCDKCKATSASTTMGRLLYLALPPTVYPQVCSYLGKHVNNLADNKRAGASSWVRVILEKPFGKDWDSSEKMADDIGKVFSEAQLFRIDHYLGKELVQNLLVLRFANTMFTSLWNRHYIDNIQISFKEDIGTQGRGGYFDEYGIIRDVIQNHLMQVLALLAMEAPVSLNPDDIRDEKTRVLRCIKPLEAKDCILGQYTASPDGSTPGYLDDPTVPKGSQCPTYACVKLNIHNDRWEGVPILIKAGKALNEKLVMVRMQLKTPAASIFGTLCDMRNEICMRFQPGEAIYTKLVIKSPGLDMKTEMSDLDLTYPDRFKEVHIPEAYERLILDAIRGDAQHFVRRDELRAAWAIFTPLLHAIDRGELKPEPYEFGSRGPTSVDPFTTAAGYIKNKYTWTKPSPQTLRPSAPPA